MKTVKSQPTKQVKQKLVRKIPEPIACGDLTIYNFGQVSYFILTQLILFGLYQVFCFIVIFIIIILNLLKINYIIILDNYKKLQCLRCRCTKSAHLLLKVEKCRVNS